MYHVFGETDGLGWLPLHHFSFQETSKWMKYAKTLHPGNLTARPKKWWLEDYFPIGKVTFQGRTVKLRGGYQPLCFPLFFFPLCRSPG